MTSPYVSSSSTTHRRPTPPTTIHNPNSSTPVIHPDIDPAPTHKPIFQFLAIGFIVFLALLQLFPATHFRDPSDPFRKWIPFQSALSSSSDKSKESSTISASNGGEDGMIHVVTWMDCLDLRLLAVLVNSTLLSTRYPDLLYFHFFIPGGEEDRVSYYKLKVLFPHTNLEILGQSKVKERIEIDISKIRHVDLSFEQLAPFAIPSIHQLGKFIYVSPNVIIKGRVEGLIGGDLSNYALAAAVDCSERLDKYVKTDVLNAIQRSASKPWVSLTPYPTEICMPSLSVLVIDARKLGIYFMEAILWWSDVLNLGDRIDSTSTAITLAFHAKYLKLPTSWLIKSSASEETNKGMIICSDAPMITCSGLNSSATPQSDRGHLWRQFLPPLSQQILGT